MIVQRTLPGEMPIVIRNADHAVAAAGFAQHFGNDRFAHPEPRHLMNWVARYHDAGWVAIDEKPLRNPKTGLPYHLADTPMPLLLSKSVAGPDFNATYHPWCGLLASMHVWGLFNYRYGLSDKVSIRARPQEYEKEIQRVLAGEMERQRRLTERLGGSSHTAGWVVPEALMASYKRLEFFDTLALHFQQLGSGLRESAEFAHVPAGPDEGDVTVAVEMTGDSSATLTPYPFDRSPLTVRCRVQLIAACETDEALQCELDARRWRIQEYTVTAGEA
jgi:hypothetical protein